MSDVEVIVGRVGRPHGLAGEVTVAVSTDEPERRFAPGTTLIAEGTGRQLTVSRHRWHSGTLLVLFSQVSDRSSAEDLRGTVLTVAVPADEHPDDPTEFYDRQLTGMLVRSLEGQDIGTVTGVRHLPAQDLLVVSSSGREWLVPFVSELVPDVDVEAGVCTVVPIPGLLDDDAQEAR